MSGPVAVSAVALGKRYRIGVSATRPRTLKDAVVGAAAAPVRNLRRLRRLRVFDEGEGDDVIWALRDASFELRHGEVLGVIGRNGAGKSTLLKILSRITSPTRGRARVAGRLAALLEVGTGFHPELTGRDNVYLNGSILGMDRRYIAKRFDEIIEFAGVARFVDTPVKRYSSGMYLRLAFAVAAHLEPDILVVDEVLAVGDAEFQQKCLRQMDEAARGGRTVLFVSHNLGAIQRLCTRAVLLESGRIVADDDPGRIVTRYLASVNREAPPGRWLDLTALPRTGSGSARFVALAYANPTADSESFPRPGGPLDLTVRIRAEGPHPRMSLAFSLRDHLGTKLINADTDAIGVRPSLPDGISTWRFSVPNLYLKPGTYQLDLWLAESVGTVVDRLQPAARMIVIERQERTLATRVDSRYEGLVVCDYDVRQVDRDSERRIAALPGGPASSGGETSL